MGFAEYLIRLPDKRLKRGPIWICSECHVKNPSRKKNCMNCGRDPRGNPATRPPDTGQRRV